MTIQEQIEIYINGQTEPKQTDMQALHKIILKIMPRVKLWFLDGRNAENKIISNPNIGYGFQLIKYADGTSKEFYQVGISGNTTGISVYILGLNDKTYLARIFGPKLGKANVTGYCIRFKKLADINIDVLEAAIRYGFDFSNLKS